MTVRQLIEQLQQVVAVQPELADVDVRVGSPMPGGATIGRIEAFRQNFKERRNGVRVYP